MNKILLIIIGICTSINVHSQNLSDTYRLASYNSFIHNEDSTIKVQRTGEGYYEHYLLFYFKDQFLVKRRISFDLGIIFVQFVDLNNDTYEDIIIELADESGFIPVIYVNENNEKLTSSLVDHFEIDYSSLDNPYSDKPYEPYRFFDEDNDGVFEIEFFKIYEDGMFKDKIIYKLDENYIYTRVN